MKKTCCDLCEVEIKNTDNHANRDSVVIHLVGFREINYNDICDKCKTEIIKMFKITPLTKYRGSECNLI